MKVVSERFGSIDSLALDQVSFTYGGHAPLLDRVSFSFPLNGVVRIAGAQGTGVSTLLQILAGLIELEQGRYLINGRDVGEFSAAELTAFQLSVGYAFDYGGLLSNQSLLENLLLPATYHGLLSVEAARTRAHKLLDEFHILEEKDSRPAMASAGARKTCILARSLILEPQVLILDNPTEGLRHEATRTLIRVIKRHQAEAGLRHLFVATEDSSFLSEFDCRTISLNGYRLVGEAMAA